MPKICIDAGHYGDYNRSPADGRYYEARVMWDLHKLLMRELRARGFDVIYTREVQEKDMYLEARGKKARGCDLFLSLHSNAVAQGVREDIDYPVAYVSVNGSADNVGLKLARCVERVMETTQKARIEHKLNSKGNADYYGVLRGAASANVPGVILEHSFHTNTKMTQWLLERENLERLARAEAEALSEYYGVGETGDGGAKAQSAKVPAPDNPSAPSCQLPLHKGGIQGSRDGEGETETGDEIVIRYKYLKDIPNNWDKEGNPRATVKKLMDAGVLNGDGSDEEGNGDVIDLSHDMMRMLIILYRGGAFHLDER